MEAQTDRTVRVHPLWGRAILVTGAEGKLGSAIAEHLTALGACVRLHALGIERRQGTSSGDERFAPSNTGDLCDPQVARRVVEDVSAIVHCAAIPTYTAAPAEVVFQNNAISTFNMLEAAGKRGVGRVVIASSINANGLSFNRHRPLPPYFPIDENTPPDIEDAYSLSKWVNEATAQMMSRRWDMSVIALRFPVTGSLEDVLREVQRTSENPDHSVREGWSYLMLDDAVRAIEYALVADISGHHVIGLAAPDALLPGDTRANAERYVPVVPIIAELDRGNSSLVNTERALRTLGFTAIHSVHVNRPLRSPLLNDGEEI